MKLKQEFVYAAIDGFKAQKLRIDAQIAELRAMLNGSPTGNAAVPEPIHKRRKISASARRRIAMAQKARWAKVRGESEPGPAMKAPKKKRRISPEGLKNIIAATKRRWRLQRAAARSK